jgi:hypothetical protein
MTAFSFGREMMAGHTKPKSVRDIQYDEMMAKANSAGLETSFLFMPLLDEYKFILERMETLRGRMKEDDSGCDNEYRSMIGAASVCVGAMLKVIRNARHITGFGGDIDEEDTDDEL